MRTTFTPSQTSTDFTLPRVHGTKRRLLALVLTAAAIVGCNTQRGAFCDRVIPLVDARIPSTEDLRTVEDEAAKLGTDHGQEIAAKAREVSDQLRSFSEGRVDSYDTGILVEPIADLCEVELLGESAEG